MTLTIQTEELEQRQAALSIAIAEERIDAAFKQKVKSLGREVQIPGFRPGKAPTSFIIKRLGADAIRSEVIDDMMPAIIEEALTGSELDVYDIVTMEDFVLQPTAFKLLVALNPIVELGDYRAIRKEIPAIDITEEAVAEHLEHVRERHEILESVERPAELGDVVTVSGKGWVAPEAAEGGESEEEADEDESIIFDNEHANFLLDAEKTFPNTPIVERLVGASVGDALEFQFNFPEDYDDETLRGREASFKLEVLEVQRRELPELDDELAQLDGEHETLEELKEDIRQNLEKSAKQEAESQLFDEFLEEVKRDAQVAYPRLMIEREADAFGENIKKEVEKIKLTWPQYVEMSGKSEAEMREQWLEDAESRLHNHLVLSELILQEKIRVTPEDIMALLDERLAQYENPEIRNYIMSMYLQGDRGRELRNEALSMKAQARVIAILAGEAPDLDTLDEEDEEE